MERVDWVRFGEDDRDELDRLADDIARLAQEVVVTQHELLSAVRRFDALDGWHVMGAKSCAHWLAWRVGLGGGAAREHVRVARRLGELPLIDGAFGRGELSYSKTRALTRVATAENEEALLSIAVNTTASQLERVCRMYRSAEDRVAPEDLDDRRWVTSRQTDDGMVRIQLQLTAEEAATVLEAMRVSAETGDRVDGAVAMAEGALSGEGVRAGKPPVEVMMHIDAGTLTGHTAEGDGVPAETCRRILCDSGVVPSLEDEAGRTIDVGRKRRTIPPAIRRALAARDQGCRFPSCTSTRCDAHHIEHWIDQGETKLDNLVLLCRRHHRYMHECGFRLELRDEQVVFVDPYGRVIPETGELPSPRIGILDRMRQRHRERGVEVGPDVAYPRWDGQSPQYEWIVDGLLQ